MKLAGPNLTMGTLLFLFVFGAATVSLFGLAQLVDSDEPPAVAAQDDVDIIPGGPVTRALAAESLLFDR